MDSCCDSMIKYFMFIINLLFAVVGLALIVIGAYIQIAAKEFLDFLSDNYLNTPIFIIIIGCIIFVVAFFGCCGAWHENTCMIYTYAAMLGLLLICEIGAGIAAFVLKGELKDVVEEKMVQGMKNYNAPGYDGVTNAWDVMQQDLNCCGSSNYTNWFQYTPNQVPDSCCQIEKKGCGSDLFQNQIYQRGCLREFEDRFKSNIGIVGGVALGVAFVQLLGVVFSCCLGKGVRKGEYV
ncbi:CD63 antigen [Eurytemora carolleeae]|uniref:CD63 antigen n=1 Tax=Eurytemora carolleeae TaxID=1294199 RepID=UPI000C785F7E|nr:CD63 antigen [Eurytemora carolleeae]|eukprot:XP_023336981.1 CD63 antigen-like [Eurytemora affinis]